MFLQKGLLLFINQRNSETTYRKQKKKRERIPSFLKLIILLLYLTLFVKREKRAAVFCHEDCLWQLNHFILHNENDFSVSKGTTSG